VLFFCQIVGGLFFLDALFGLLFFSTVVFIFLFFFAVICLFFLMFLFAFFKKCSSSVFYGCFSYFSAVFCGEGIFMATFFAVFFSFSLAI